MAAAPKDDAIDVSSVDTSAFPRAKGGLRKLFQLPAAANGENGEEVPPDDTGPGNGAKKGSAKTPTAGGATKGGASGSSTKGGQARSGSSGASSSRRRNNKKRKRR
jgi:hypothetical protein